MLSDAIGQSLWIRPLDPAIDHPTKPPIHVLDFTDLCTIFVVGIVDILIEIHEFRIILVVDTIRFSRNFMIFV